MTRAGSHSPAPVVWLTGLSGAGKSTIGERICLTLWQFDVAVEFLDGDAIRAALPTVGFSHTERDAHVRRVAFLASRLAHHGVFVVAALISPYRESRAFARSLCRQFVEVHVATPLDVCEARDLKGLYARARRGDLQRFTGIDDPYEPPLAPELVVDTSRLSVDQAADLVLEALARRTPGLLVKTLMT